MAISDAKIRIEGLKAGDMVAGRYDLLSEVGEGGMGRVSRACDRELDDIVALKVLRGQLVLDPRAAALFRSEIKTARRISSPYVARAFEFGSADGVQYITMEFVEGQSLAELLMLRGRLPVSNALDIARDLAQGLLAAHRANVVHRDVKPGNVLIRRDGRAVLTDFGVARVNIDGEAHSGRTTVGTPGYMAPEQVRCDPVTPATDIYAFGVMLYEMLTGKLPWSASDPFRLIAARLTTPPEAFDDSLGLSNALTNFVFECMANEPGQRPSDMNEVLACIESFGEPDTHAAHAAPVRLTPAATPSTPRVAVLPFDYNGDPALAYLADGLAEDLVGGLSSIKRLRVLSMRAATAILEQQPDATDAGRALGVSHIVEASVRQIEDTFRVNVRLITVADGHTLSSHRHDRTRSTIDDLDEALITQIASALELTAQRGDRVEVSDGAALQAYFEARRLCHSYLRTKLQRAVVLFEQARVIAPDDPMILSGLALALVRLWTLAQSVDDKEERYVFSLIERAVALGRDLAEPQVAMGAYYFVRGNTGAATRSLRCAIARSPSCVEANEMLGTLLIEAGHKEEGRRRHEAALALEPGLMLPRWDALRDALVTNDLEREVMLLGQLTSNTERATRWFIESWSATMRRDAAHLARVRAQIEAVGDLDDFFTQFALRMCSVFLHLEPADALLGFLDKVILLSGRANRPKIFYLQVRAEVCCFAGMPEEGLAAIAHAVEAGMADRAWLDRSQSLIMVRPMRAFAPLRAVVHQRAAQVLDELYGDASGASSKAIPALPA